MDRPDTTYAARATARNTWNISRYELGQEPSEDLRGKTSAAERLEMMWTMACDAWSFAGRDIPDYPRDQTPVRVIRPSETD